jgi:hypothetical protein
MGSGPRVIQLFFGVPAATDLRIASGHVCRDILTRQTSCDDQALPKQSTVWTTGFSGAAGAHGNHVTAFAWLPHPLAWRHFILAELILETKRQKHPCFPLSNSHSCLAQLASPFAGLWKGHFCFSSCVGMGLGVGEVGVHLDSASELISTYYHFPI